MPWNEQLPRWDNEGSEPPESKKDSGWQVGEKPPAGWINWLFNKIYRCIKEIRENVIAPYVISTSVDDTYLVSMSGVTAYSEGLIVHFKASVSNTGAVHLNINNLGAKPIYKNITSVISDNDIKQNQIVTVVYDGTNFQLISAPYATVTANSAVSLTNKILNNPRIEDGTSILDIAYKKLIRFIRTENAVNEITIKNNSTGSAPELQASGTDNNIDLNLVSKGTGAVKANGKEVALKETVDAHSADYAYQIPIIVGTQIRINRLSNTNRLYFKLESDLTSGAITISIDGGTTSKSLKDINGMAITQLEKGFVEVVADTNFFILRSRGISATDKQSLINIVNNAEANQSTIKTNIINALNSKVGSGLTASSTWIDIQNTIGNMTNKRWKAGTVISSNTPETFTTASGGGEGRYECVISGLTFQPSLILVYSSTSGFNSLYKQGLFNASGSNFGDTYLATGTIFRTVLPIYVNTTGFKIPVTTANTLYNWIAFE